MKVSNCMTRGIEGIQSSDSIMRAAIRMKDLDIGALAVFESNRLMGIITDRDIVIRVVAKSLNPASTYIGDIMSKNPKICRESTTLDDAVRIMENNKVRRLLVENDNGQITGILTIGDIAVRGDEDLVSEVIREVKQHSGPIR